MEEREREREGGERRGLEKDEGKRKTWEQRENIEGERQE